MKDHINASNFPSLMIGDFNDLLKLSDKKGGAYINLNKTRRLHEFTQQCSMIDLTTKGNDFTWRKHREGDNSTFEKLDRALAQQEVIQVYPHIFTWNHAFTTSDHCRISVNLQNIGQRIRNKPFRFEMMWTQRKECENLIKQTWRTQFHGTRMFNVVKKLSLLKNRLKVWSRVYFGNINRQVSEVENAIEKLQGEIITTYSAD